MHEMNPKEIAKILDNLKQNINYALLQTTPNNRDDLRQHLYVIILKTLHNNTLKKPKGLLK